MFGMSKKNNRQKDKRYIKFLIEREKSHQELKEKLTKRKENARIKAEEATLNAQRKAINRKPKVAPVIGSKVKLEKMLKRQMKTLSIGSSKATKAKKLNMEDSSSGSDGEAEGDEQMDTGENQALMVPRIGQAKIKKVKAGMSRT